MANSLTVKNFIEVAKLLPTDISVLLRGETGIGKSQITHQLGKHFGLKVIDRRLSQMTDGDMIGLPSTDGEVTRFNPPDWYKDACNNPRLLFLDELNRATTEVMQAAFQIVLDRELNGVKLHKDTRVYCAINIGSKFTVNEMDPALLRRFFVVDLAPTTEDWIKWAQSENVQINEMIVDFIRAHDSFLDPAKNAEPNSVQPTRHSWERLDAALKFANISEEPTHPMFHIISMGFLGTEPALALCEFCRSQNNRISGEDVITRYPEVRKKVKAKTMTVDKLNAIIDRTVNYVVKDLKSLDEAQGKNLQLFAGDLDKELRVVLWSRLVQAGIENLDLAIQVHKYMYVSVLDVFGVPPGDKGVNVKAKIPSEMNK